MRTTMDELYIDGTIHKNVRIFLNFLQATHNTVCVALPRFPGPRYNLCNSEKIKIKHNNMSKRYKGSILEMLYDFPIIIFTTY